jgi:type I restriction enzyme S subunit
MIPAEWTIEPLERLVEYNSGRTPARANPVYWEGDDTRVPWVAISDMENYGTISKTREAITRRAFEDVFRRRLVPAGTLLMSFKLTIGRVATLGIDACHNEAIISIRPKARVDQRYLGYFLSQVDYDDLQDRQIKGNTLNQDKIDRIPVVLPPKQEQCDIADVLDFVRQAITLETKATEVAGSLKRAAMRDLFATGLRGKAPKETELGLIPDNWDVVEFGSVREWLQYGTSTPCTYKPTAFPVLRIPNIQTGSVNSEDIKYGNLRTDEANRYRLAHGDLIFIRTNGVIERLGTCAVYAGQPANALFASYLIRARLKLEQVNPHFLAQFFASERGTQIIAGRATPAADGKYNLNTGTIDGLPIPLPPTLDEQREIVAILDAIDRKVSLHQRKRAVLENLFNVLLHKLMTGEIRVADLDLSVLGEAPLEGVAA